jgi:hypothetical protein
VPARSRHTLETPTCAFNFVERGRCLGDELLVRGTEQFFKFRDPETDEVVPLRSAAGRRGSHLSPTSIRT